MKTLSQHFFSAFRIALAVGMLYYLAQSGSINWSSFTGLINAWHYTLFAIALFVVGTIFQAYRLQILINAQHMELSLPASVRLTFIGLFFNTFLPGATGGDLVKIYYASKGNPGSRAEVITILLLDRFLGLFSLLTLPLLLAPFFVDLIAAQPSLQFLLAASLAIAIGFIVVAVIGAKTDLANSRLLHWVQQKFSFGRLLARVLHTLHAYRNNLSALYKALFFAYLLQLLMVLIALAVAEATNAAGADLKMLVLIPMGFLASALPITPGGLGVGEAALASLFTLAGLQGGAETLLGWRLIMIASSLIGLVFFLRGEQRFVFSGEQNHTDSKRPN